MVDEMGDSSSFVIHIHRVHTWKRVRRVRYRRPHLLAWWYPIRGCSVACSGTWKPWMKMGFQ